MTWLHQFGDFTTKLNDLYSAHIKLISKYDAWLLEFSIEFPNKIMQGDKKLLDKTFEDLVITINEIKKDMEEFIDASTKG